MANLRVQPDVVTCSALLHGYCRAQRMGEAIALFDKLLDAGLKPDVVLFNTLIHGYCSTVGDIEKACELIGVMVQRRMVPNESTYVALVMGLERKRFVNSEKHASILLGEILVANSAK